MSLIGSLESEVLRLYLFNSVVISIYFKVSGMVLYVRSLTVLMMLIFKQLVDSVIVLMIILVGLVIVFYGVDLVINVVTAKKNYESI